MKKLIAILSLLALGPVCAGDTATYEGTITGVVCAACKQHVTEALTAKIDGITEVKITPGEKEGEQKITITSKKDGVTKDSAVQALGELAETYKRLSLEKKD